MSDARIACPVLTCTRDIPAGAIMCVWCWARVPKDLRAQIGNRRADRRGDKVRLAIAAAQAAPDGAAT
jgi:hypothetical protein